MKRRLVFFGLIAVPVMVLFVVTLTLAMAFALQDDVDALEKRIRAGSKTEKNLRADIEAIRTDLLALQAEPAAAVPPKQPVAAAAPTAPEPVVRASSLRFADSARVVKVNAVAPPECIFKPGDPDGLADCIRSRQGRIDCAQAQIDYR